ncbi:PDZ/DHR/GLGF domain protein, partial [Cooperia oncophora]
LDFRSRTPAAEFRYGEQTRSTTQSTVSPRSKTPAPTQRQESDPNIPTSRAQTLQRQPNVTQSLDAWDGATAVGSRMRPSSTTIGFATPNYMPISAFQFNKPSDLITVNLIRKPNGFGFRLLGGSEVVPREAAAADDGRMQEGDEIIEIDGRNVEDAVRRQSLHGERPLSGISAANSGEYDVTLNRSDTDGFGFIIISSLNRNGSTIG